MPHRRSRTERERGQALVLFTLSLIVILAFAGIVVDLGLLRNNRQVLVNAIDSAALAGGSLLPVDGSVPNAAASEQNLVVSTLNADYSGLTLGSDYKITYKCLIGVDSSGNPYISRDVPAVCDPRPSHGGTVTNASFLGSGSTRYTSCDPTTAYSGLYDKCNVVVVSGSATTKYGFAPVVGINSGSTGAVQAAACHGPCGASPFGPVDVVLVTDRTGSMSGVDTTNSLAAANTIRTGYNPAIQWLGFGLLGPSKANGSCIVAPDSMIGTAVAPADLRRWIPIGLSGTAAPSPWNYDYTTASNTMANNMKTPCYTNSGTGTDLADPIYMATYELQHNGRTGVKKGIILETDGQPNTATPATNATNPGNYCAQANAAATAAKTAGIEIFTIGFGLDGSNNIQCPDGSGAFKGKTATFSLASMATQPSSDQYGCPGAGTVNSNTDLDHFFCLPKTSGASTDLSSVFYAAAQQLATGRPFLVQLYPTPVVKSVSPNTAGPKAGGQTVTITGSFFTGTTSVTFGAAPATNVTVTSDTTMTVTSPGGGANSTVDVIVTTGGGSSPIVGADQYTYGP